VALVGLVEEEEEGEVVGASQADSVGALRPFEAEEEDEDEEEGNAAVAVGAGIAPLELVVMLALAVVVLLATGAFVLPGAGAVGVVGAVEAVAEVDTGTEELGPAEEESTFFWLSRNTRRLVQCSSSLVASTT
jgi:hypothetical protein